MNPDQIMSRMQEVFDKIHPSRVRLSRKLRPADLEGWDSMHQVALILALEEAFSIQFHLGEVEQAKTIGDLIDVVAKRAKRAG